MVARTSFAVGEAAPPPSPPVIVSAEPFETAARWLSAAGLTLLVGVLAVRWRRPAVPVDRPPRLRTLVRVGALGVLFGRFGVLAARIITLGGDRWAATRTVLGHRRCPAIRSHCAGPGVMASGEGHRQRPAGLDGPLAAQPGLARRPALDWLGVAWVVCLASWGSHSSLGGSYELLAVMAKAAHLAGARAVGGCDRCDAGDQRPRDVSSPVSARGRHEDQCRPDGRPCSSSSAPVGCRPSLGQPTRPGPLQSTNGGSCA